MNDQRILVVDDERTILDTVRVYLEQAGFQVETAMDGRSALSLERAFRPDLVVLDIMLPELDGLEVLRRLRQTSSVYILMLTARADEVDKIVGLGMGADDYMTKPFSPRELVARIRAVLRRARGSDEGEPPYLFERLRFDPDARRIWKDGEEITLTQIEYDLASALARNAGRVLSRDQLIEQVWGHDYYGDERVVDVHIGRVRKKLEDDPAEPTLIVTVRGAGYRFEDAPR